MNSLASFIRALFWVYYVLIFIRVVFSWVGIPSDRTMLSIFRFVYDVTEPYLGIFRRFVPVFGGIDLSPFIGILVLVIVQNIIISLLRGY